jgi:hypothetical protein
LSFKPLLLNNREFLSGKKTFEYFDLACRKQHLPVNPGELAFTFCQVPFIYVIHEKDLIEISFSDGTMDTLEGLRLNRTISDEIFRRTGRVTRIRVHLSG